MKCCKVYVVIIAVLLCSTVRGQQSMYQFAQLDFSQGLSNNQVNCIYKDAKGFMWFGTTGGLNRYDGYSFKVFKHDIKDSTSLGDDLVIDIFEADEGKFWVKTGYSGFSIYDPSSEKFDNNIQAKLSALQIPLYGLSQVVKTEKGCWFAYADSGLYFCSGGKLITALKLSNTKNTSIDASSIADVRKDKSGNVWIVHRNGAIEKLDAKTNAITYKSTAIQKINPGEYSYQVFIDNDNACWLYTKGLAAGLFYLNTANNTAEKMSKEAGKIKLNNDIINGLVQDEKGLIWVITDHGGVNIINKQTWTSSVLLNNPYDNKTIAQNSLTTIYKDNLGIIWMGTFKRGVSYYHESIFKFHLYRHQPSDVHSLPYDDINKFAEDANGNLWIATNGGGLLYFNRKDNSFKQFTHDPSNQNSLSNDVVVGLCLDHENKLWIGTYFGGLDCYDGKTFKHYRHNDKDTNSIADNAIWEIFEDSYHTIWIGTFDHGLERFDREKNIFHHYRPTDPNSVRARYISQMTESKEHDLWIATAYGLDRLNLKSGIFSHYNNSSSKLSNDNIISVIADSRGYIWAGTRDGLDLFDPVTNTFHVFRVEDGLPDNVIVNILEDDAHDLWLSTPNGISRIHVKGDFKNGISIECKNYDELDGLQGREFNQKAAIKTSTGEIAFAGANGFNIFKPTDITSNKNAPPVIFTGLQVFNRTINPQEKINDHIILPNAISETKTITLKYNENVFSIEFAALSYTNSPKNKYSYKLDGFNQDWLFTDGSSRKVTYTNLDPGEYTFRVKAANEDGVWNSEGTTVKIIILPPFWKTPLAYAIYFIIAVAILYFARRLVIQRAKMRFALEQERKEAQRMHELDMMKIRFFTNVSHEFRTPLSLILTPLDKIIRNTSDAAARNQFQMIHRNGRRVLNLVNQLLDFRKMEVQELKLSMSDGDIAKFVKDISYSFTDIAEKKNIIFSYESAIESLHTKFDHDKLERILFNLLSNAFKFTPEHGHISVEFVSIVQDEENFIQINVRDTGIGIPLEKQDKIFERFFQNELPGTMVNQGSGIGLAITKEFVKLHGGTITVESEEDKGSCFTVTLPVHAANIVQPVLNDAKEEASLKKNTADELPKTKKYTILLVEDNEDFRFYLKDNLREYFNIAEAANGALGWQKTLSAHPDIVVSDVHMPVMDGIELCKKIKQDQRTRQIPVVLLTALIGEEQQLRALETGAADYITKPFNFEIMLSRLKNILQQQESLKQTFTRHVEVKTSDIPVSSPDEKFVQEALSITEKHLSNADFNVEELSKELCMSRVAVYKKLFALTGKAPTEFIREVRLQRAAQLLLKTQMTVAEVAYEVGFNNPKYFSKYFKAQYGVLPSVYAAEINAGKQSNPQGEEELQQQ